MSVSRMVFHPKASDNRKNVTCRAENTNIRGSAIEDTITLDVHCKCLPSNFISFWQQVLMKLLGQSFPAITTRQEKFSEM